MIVNITYAETCIDVSQRTYNRAIRWGYQARIAEGYYKGKPHQWVEWWNEKRNLWCVWDDALSIGRSKYTAEEMGYEKLIKCYRLKTEGHKVWLDGKSFNLAQTRGIK